MGLEELLRFYFDTFSFCLFSVWITIWKSYFGLRRTCHAALFPLLNLEWSGKTTFNRPSETLAIKSNMVFHFSERNLRKWNANTIRCRSNGTSPHIPIWKKNLGHSLIDCYDLKMASNEHLKSVKLQWYLMALELHSVCRKLPI
jgi:hypothetical protein